MTNWQSRYIAVFLFLLNFSVYVFGQTPTASPEPIGTNQQTNADQKCGFEGNNDAYGLGIRLGIYIQWIIAAATSCFLTDGGRSVIGISNCYRLAMFIGLLFITIKRGPELQASEAAVMFMLGAGGAFTKVDAPDLHLLPRSGRHSTDASIAALGSAVQVLIRIALGSYAVWFFSTGMDRMQHPPCSSFGFLFVKVNLYGWARILFNIIAACHIFVNVCILLSPVLAPSPPRTPTPPPPTDPLLYGPPLVDPASTDNKALTDYKAFGIGTVVLTIFVTGVELLIRWNHIQRVNRIDSTGQLLPLVVSLGTLISLIWRGILAAGNAVKGGGGSVYEVGVMA